MKKLDGLICKDQDFLSTEPWFLHGLLISQEEVPGHEDHQNLGSICSGLADAA